MAVKKHIQTQTEWENEMAGKILDFIRSELYLDLPFMDIALSKLIPAPKAEISTFATNGTYVWYSDEQLFRLFERNGKFLDRAYLHTVLHCIFSHLWVRGERSRAIWDIACDIAVEYTIDGMDKPCTRRILSWLRQKTYEELKKLPYGISAATIYEWIMQQEPGRQQALQREFRTDDHRFWPREEQGQSPTPQQQNPQQEWQKIARQTSMEQRKKGEDPGQGEQLLAAQITAEKSRRSYWDFLRQFTVLREEMHCDPDEFDLSYYSYGLRLYGNMPLIEPVESRETKKIREFVIVIDTSYSTSGQLVKNFLKETYTILSQTDSFFHRSRIRIIQCDDAVRMDEEIRSQEQMEALLNRFTIVGGGGTDFRPAFAYVNELVETGLLKNLSGLLYFTDGKGTYPKKRPSYKAAFLFLGSYDETAVPVWAIRLQLDPTEFGNSRSGSGAAGNSMAGNGVAGNGMAGNDVAGNGMAGNGMVGNGMAGNAASGYGVYGSENVGNGFPDTETDDWEEEMEQLPNT